jgi:hypothetical protein
VGLQFLNFCQLDAVEAERDRIRQENEKQSAKVGGLCLEVRFQNSDAQGF